MTVHSIAPAAFAGPVAQRLEPAAHNGLVAGSSPAGPTNDIKHFACIGILTNFCRLRYRLRNSANLFALRLLVHLGITNRSSSISLP